MAQYNETIDLNETSPSALKSNVSNSFDEKFDLSDKSFTQISAAKADPSAGFFNPVGSTGIGKSQYDTGISLGQLTLQPLEEIRASKQGWASQLGNALAGGIGSGAIGALEGFTNLGDQLMNIGNTAEEWERGTLSTVLNDLKTDINELTPLYRKDRADVFDWNDSGFYFEVLKGAVDSAVAFGLPGAGYGMAVGKLGSILGKAGIAGKRLDVLTRAGGRAIGISNPAQKLGAGTAALLSNYNEGTVMGMQVYDEKKEEFMNTLSEDLMNKKIEAGEDPFLSPEELKNIELESSLEAGKAAETVRDYNHFMVASNYLSVRSLFNGAKSTAARSLVKQPTLKNWVKDQAIGAPMEAMEEIAQGVLQSEVGYRAQDNIYTRNNVDVAQIAGLEEYRRLDGMEFSDRLLDFATKDETLLEGMMGLISGPIQYAVTGLPSASKNKAAQQLRYNKQQGIIGRNETFIKDKLTFNETAQDLIGKFDDFRKNILGKDEMSPEDLQAYTDLIENTAADTLIVENFFGGTTENLEKQLQGVVQDENATPEEKAAAEKHLTRLGELEQRFNQYSMYQDGAHMFATKVRTERLDEIKKILDTAYPAIEADLTKMINSKLEANAKRNKERKLNKLEEVLYYYDEVETLDDKGKKKVERTRVPVRSVTQAVDAYIEGKELKSSYGSIHNEFKNGKAFDVATKNRMMKSRIDGELGFYNRVLDESGSLDYENEFAKYQDTASIQDSKEKVAALKEVKKGLDNKYPASTYINLKTRVQNEISFLEKAITDAEQTQAQANSQVASVQTEEAKKKKVETKTTGKKPTVATTPDPSTDPIVESGIDPDASFQQNPDNFPDIDIPEGNRGNDFMAGLEAKALAKKDAPAQPVDKAAAKKALKDKMKMAKEGLMKSGKTAEEAEAIVLKRLSPEDQALREEILAEKAKKEATTQDNKNTKVNEIEKKKNKIRVINKQPLQKNNPNGPNTNIERNSIEIKRIGLSIDKKIDSGKSSDEIISELNSQGIVGKANFLDSFRQFIKDKQSGITKQTFEEWYNETLENTAQQSNPAHLLSDEEAQANLDNFEPKPTTQDDTKINQKNIQTTVNQNKAKVEGSEEGTRAKIMTTGATIEFESKVLKNFRDKTGIEVDVNVSSRLPQGMYGKGEALAMRAISVYQNAKTKGYNKVDFDFMVKYLPISVDFGGGAISYLYPMNWENDSTLPENKGKAKTSYTDVQNEGEKSLRTKAITAALKGGKIKVKVKGQTPGALNFGTEEKMLSEIDGFIENPMNVKMFVSIDGGLQPAVKGDTYNPFFGTKMTYSTATGSEAWTGIYVIEVKAMNGMSFPLKINTKNHDQVSAEIIYDLFQKMVSSKKGEKNIMNVSVLDNDKALYDRITALLPNLPLTYGKGFTYSEVLNDMVFEGNKTRGRASELLFEKGKVIFGGNSLTSSDFSKAENKAKFVQFIQDFKTFNVNVAKLGDPAYRKHVFSSYLSTNADIDNMFTADGTLNPNGDSAQRMKSGAIYLDVPSAELVFPEKKVEEVKPKAPAKTEADRKKALTLNKADLADAIVDATAGNITIETKEDLDFEKERKALSDVESGIQGITGAEIQALKQQRDALLPEPDPDSMTREEYDAKEKEVKASKEWKAIQKDIDELEGKSKTKVKTVAKPVEFEIETLSVMTLKEILDFDMYARIYGARNFLNKPRAKILDQIEQKKVLGLAKGASETAKILYQSALNDLKKYDEALKIQEENNPFNQPPKTEENKPKSKVEEMVEAKKKSEEAAKEIDRCKIGGKKNLAAAKAAAKNKLGPIDL